MRSARIEIVPLGRAAGGFWRARGRLRLRSASGNLIAQGCCALGKEGVAAEKREGDQKTPLGLFALRRVFYRADRETRPWTRLPCQPIRPGDLWCHDPASPFYNRFRRQARFSNISGEALYRADKLYDLLLVLGFNDAPVRKGRGSAIFLHLARNPHFPTEGCIAVSRPLFLRLAALADQRSFLRIGD